MSGDDHGGESNAQPSDRTAIHLRRPDDIAACVALLAAVHAADGYPLQWPADPAAWLTPARLLAAWVAEDGAGITGHVTLRGAAGAAAAPHWTAAAGVPAERIAEVARLFVAPRARGQGIGAALLATACAAARQRALLPALVVADHDRAAMALYARAGWRRMASVPADWTLASGEPMVLHYYLAPS